MRSYDAICENCRFPISSIANAILRKHAARLLIGALSLQHNHTGAKMIDSCDSVCTPGNVWEPDPLTQYQTLEQRICYIVLFTLSADVPDEVRSHFKTGRNLFVYAWHVYRFNMVAEQHILAILEMAVCSRLASFTGDEAPRDCRGYCAHITPMD